MKKWYLLFAIVFYFCNCKPQSLKIIPVNVLSEMDTIRHGQVWVASRIDYFIIEDYSGNNIRNFISDYIKKNIDSAFLRLDQYDAVFYAKSDKANIDYINSFPKNLRYKAIEDEKPLFTYTWFKGKLVVH